MITARHFTGILTTPLIEKEEQRSAFIIRTKQEICKSALKESLQMVHQYSIFTILGETIIPKEINKLLFVPVGPVYIFNSSQNVPSAYLTFELTSMVHNQKPFVV